jgi:4-amino-4-deoxy-L-arabinose transferase-like glycosyltransferase
MFSKRLIPYFTLLAVVLISTLLVWAPFLTRSENWLGLQIKNSDFLYIYKHFDGPLYIIPAKTMYDPKEIAVLNRDSVLSQDPKYFSAHLPLYPALIRLASPFVGYLKGMIGVTQLFSVFLAFLFYLFLKRFNITKHPLILTSVFLFLPRFLVVRSVGAPETLFMFLILLSLFFFEKGRYAAAGITGALAVMTKTPGILLFGAYGLVFLERFVKERKLKASWFFILLIPLGFLAVCALYGVRTGDYLAYFHSGDNIHLVSPFAVFDFQKSWVGTAWLEDVLFYFLLYGLAVYQLKDSRHRSLFYFSLVYWTATLFVQHRDISRYSLPLWPLACIAFENFLTSKKFLTVAAILLLGIFFYAWNFLIYNIMPINEWLPFL